MGHLNNAATSHGQEGAAGTPLAILSLVRKPCYEPIPCSTRAQIPGDGLVRHRSRTLYDGSGMSV